MRVRTHEVPEFGFVSVLTQGKLGITLRRAIDTDRIAGALVAARWALALIAVRRTAGRRTQETGR